MRKISLFIIMLFFLSAVNISNAQEELALQKQTADPGYQKAHAIASVVDMIIRSARAEYTQMVTGKLERDGFGSAVDHMDKKGFAPLPAQYIRAIAYDVTLRGKKEQQDLLSFYLHSRWNLNSEQGLRNDFEKKGWAALSQQQEDHLKGGKSLKNLKWQPYVDVAVVDGRKTLRYLSADPASKISCVTCHNVWEQKDSVKALRKQAGVEEGKVFRLDELMGALAIYVPLEGG